MTAPLIFPATENRAPDVRAFAPAHLGDVTRLFHKTFRGRKGTPPNSLSAYLNSVFLEHPWRDPDLSSLVHVSDDGRVNGFIGVLPLKMTLNGKPVRAAAAGALMVDEPQKNPLAGARLLRAFISGPQDISISETANPVSQGMWMRLGGRVLPLSSMEWLKVFKPFGAGVAFASHVVPAMRFLSPIAGAADALLARWKRNPFRSAPPASHATTREEDADEDRFVAYARHYASQFALHPDWDEKALRWLLTHASAKEAHGPMVRRLVYGKGHTPIGGYIAYVRAGGVAWVLHVLAEPGRVDPILDSLAACAQSHGAVALRGRTHPSLMEPLLKRGCFFLHRSSTLVHARDASLMDAAAQNALINGLAAENWSRLVGGIFR